MTANYFLVISLANRGISFKLARTVQVHLGTEDVLLFRLLACVAFFVAALPSAAFARDEIACEEANAPGFDPNFQAVQQDRERYGRVIFIFGDSIARGYALGIPGDQVPRGANVLWPIRSPSATVNLILRDGGVRQRLDACGTLSGGDLVAVYAGAAGQPGSDTARQAATRLRWLVANGVIRTSDLVVLEDAGAHGDDSNAYEANWLALREALAESGATVVMMTIFDELEGQTDRMSYRYDIVDSARGRSFNDATRSAASAVINGRAAVLLELPSLLRDFDQRAAYLGIRSLRSDGIHPNVWGQCVLSAALARTAGVAVPQSPSLQALLSRWSDRLNNSAAPTPRRPDSAAAAVGACVASASAVSLER